MIMYTSLRWVVALSVCSPHPLLPLSSCPVSSPPPPLPVFSKPKLLLIESIQFLFFGVLFPEVENLIRMQLQARILLVCSRFVCTLYPKIFKL